MESNSPPASRGLPTWSIAFAAVVVLAGLSYGLAGYPLLEPDEGRNAEVAREMAEANDYVLPTLNGLPYLDKPIFYFLVNAAGMEVLGPTEFAARLPSLLFTLATLLLVYWFARRNIGGTAGWIAALATGSMPLTLGFARTVIFDSTLTFFVVAAITFFYTAIETPAASQGAKGEPAYWWTVGGWAAIALGVLTKGPVALAVPLVVLIPYGLWRRRARRLTNAVALLTFVALLLPWIRAMSVRVPDFLHYALVTETFVRLTTDEMDRTGPIWYFLPILLAGSLPWSAVVLGGLKSAFRQAAKRDRTLLVFLVGWVLLPLLFFSLSQSKRPQYILPLMPAVGILAGFLWSNATRALPGARTTSVFLGVLGVVFIAAGRSLGDAFGASGAVAAEIPTVGYGLGVATLAAAVVAWTVRRREIVFPLMTVPVALIPFVALGLMNAIAAERSAAELAQTINAVRTRDTEIIAIGTYPLSLPFYLRSQLIVSTEDGAELTSNYLYRTLDRWRTIPGTTLRPADWWREFVASCERPRIFIAKNHDVETRAVLAAALPLLAATRKVSVYGPCESAILARGNHRRAGPKPEPDRS